MSMYPLAHDLEGNPIHVPPEVAYWRVRRQPSRQGRPGRVSGLDGSPLCVPVDASADDMRAEGCGPDKYRLDGLDFNRQPVTPPVVAFTEIIPTEADLVAKRAGSSDPAAYRMAESLARALDSATKLEGITRMVEGWQRSQTEIMVALVKGKLPSREEHEPETLRDKIEEYREIRRLVDPPGLRNANVIDAVPIEKDESTLEQATKLIGAIGTTLPAIQALMGKTVEQPAPRSSAVVETAEDEDDEDDEDTAEDQASSIPAEFQPVLAALSTEERAALARLASKLDLGTLQKLALALVPLDLDAQTKRLRKIIRDYQNKEIAMAHRAVFGVLSESEVDDGKGG